MANDVLIDVQRALDLDDRGRRQGEIEEEIQAITVVLNGIGEAAASHRIHPDHLPIMRRDRLRHTLDERSCLLVADIWVDNNAEIVVSCRLCHAVSSSGLAPTDSLRTRMCAQVGGAGWMVEHPRNLGALGRRRVPAKVASPEAR